MLISLKKWLAAGAAFVLVAGLSVAIPVSHQSAYAQSAPEVLPVSLEAQLQAALASADPAAALQLLASQNPSLAVNIARRVAQIPALSSAQLTSLTAAVARGVPVAAANVAAIVAQEVPEVAAAVAGAVAADNPAAALQVALQVRAVLPVAQRAAVLAAVTSVVSGDLAAAISNVVAATEEPVEPVVVVTDTAENPNTDNSSPI